MKRIPCWVLRVVADVPILVLARDVKEGPGTKGAHRYMMVPKPGRS